MVRGGEQGRGKREGWLMLVERGERRRGVWRREAGKKVKADFVRWVRWWAVRGVSLRGSILRFSQLKGFLGW